MIATLHFFSLLFLFSFSFLFSFLFSFHLIVDAITHYSTCGVVAHIYVVWSEPGPPDSVMLSKYAEAKHPTVSQSKCLSVCLSLLLCVCLSTYLPVCLPACMSLLLPGCLSGWLSFPHSFTCTHTHLLSSLR